MLVWLEVLYLAADLAGDLEAFLNERVRRVIPSVIDTSLDY